MLQIQHASSQEVCPSDIHPNCFACSTDNPIGLGLRFIPIAPRKVQATFYTRALFQGYSNRLHGGIISTLLDAAMTHCLFSQGVEALTAELKVRFLEPVELDKRVLLEAELISKRKGIYTLEAQITLEQKRLALATAKFLCPK
ncbi:PaaI family thioesterase [Echinimonas agarilytica]|uniref:Acyl-coenzyme A thioesterase THEM4 n=1 Tax=Echinimonas agarilytica TaxID=1215918 RepID=A0AA41W3U2_9GAMM|nr:PaaI family thioesterase [Echinimonas agarilytica]